MRSNRRKPALQRCVIRPGLKAVEEIGVRTQIKWPNDLLVEERKVAGMLAEMRGQDVVVGIGINVNQTADELDQDARVQPGSLRSATGREHDRALLLAVDHEVTYRGRGADRRLVVVADHDLPDRDRDVTGLVGAAPALRPSERISFVGQPVPFQLIATNRRLDVLFVMGNDIFGTPRVIKFERHC